MLLIDCQTEPIYGDNPLYRHPELQKHYPKLYNAEVSLQRYRGTPCYQWYYSRHGGLWRPFGGILVIEQPAGDSRD